MQRECLGWTPGRKEGDGSAGNFLYLAVACKKSGYMSDNTFVTDHLYLGLRSYTFALLHLILQPLLKYGIALEAHGQNMLLRVDIQTHEIAGFAVRDIGGIKIHMPTLRQQGYELRSALPGNVIETDDRTKVWGRTHHALFQVHLNQLIRALRLQHDGGWGIVREELRRFVDVEMENGAVAKEMEEFFLEKTMPMKCFLSMRMEGIYRTVSSSYFVHFAGRSEAMQWLMNRRLGSHSTFIGTYRIFSSVEPITLIF